MRRKPCRALFVVIAMLLLLTCPHTLPAADWFVAAGAKDGDGSRARPFHDPWRALAAASAGDVIHIAQGVYHGRHDRSVWIVDRPRISVLGGYDQGFTQRDPWANPSVLAFHADYEGVNEASLLIGAEDHTGVVIDGLVLDGGGRNRYDLKPPMGLRGGLNSVGPLVMFSSSDVVIRNFVLTNSLSGAAHARSARATGREAADPRERQHLRLCL